MASNFKLGEKATGQELLCGGVAFGVISRSAKVKNGEAVFSTMLSWGLTARELREVADLMEAVAKPDGGANGIVEKGG